MSQPAWRRYLRFLGSNIREDVDDELAFHADMREKEFVARGMSETEARAAVMQRLGDLDRAKAECIELGRVRDRNARNADYVDALRSDVHFAFRSFGRAPGWTAIALITIALGIGAATTVLSVADTLLVRPVRYPGSSRIHLVRREIGTATASSYGPIGGDLVAEWRRRASSIEALEPFLARDARLGAGEDAPMLRTAAVDSGFFNFAGARPLIGRTFAANEMTADGPRVALIGEAFWRRTFDGSPNALGAPVSVNGQVYTIIGVMPATLALPDPGAEPRDVWLPLAASNDVRVWDVAVRLRPAADAALATAQLQAIDERLTGDSPMGAGGKAFGVQIRVMPPSSTLRFRHALVMLTGAVALLLLVSCSNVAHLLLARAAARERELAVRFAIGAGRGRLVRQLLTESLLITLLGGALAATVGWTSLRLVVAAHPAQLTSLSRVSPSGTAIAIAAALALATGLGVGWLVAVRAARRGIADALRAGAASGSRGGSRARAGLVVGELALSATLLVGALLLAHGVFALQRIDVGYDSRGLHGVTFSARGPALRSPEQREAFRALLRQRAHELPGFMSATVASTTPANSGFFLGGFETPERPATPGAGDLVAMNSVAPDFFSVMGTRFVAGRTFDGGSLARHEVIINERLARQLWPAGDPIGRRFRVPVPRPDGTMPWYVVAGVVRNVVLRKYTEEADPCVFLPLEEGDVGRVTILVRLAPGDAGTSLRTFASSLQAGGSAPRITNVEQSLNDSLVEPRFAMAVLSAFAIVAVALAAVGLYGVIAFAVAQRTREIGIRMTLGATGGSIARLIIRDGTRLAAIGVGLGLLAAAAGTRLLEHVLYGVSRFDPFSFAVGALCLLLVALLACVVPMLRASAVDPAVAMRLD